MALNCVLSFEDALTPHVSLGHILGHLNGYGRSINAGRRTAVNFCIYTESARIVVVESKLGGKSAHSGKAGDGEAGE